MGLRVAAAGVVQLGALGLATTVRPSRGLDGLVGRALLHDTNHKHRQNPPIAWCRLRSPVLRRAVVTKNGDVHNSITTLA